MTTEADGPCGSALSEGLGPLVERLLKYSDIRRNDPRENREALRDLIVGELSDELRAVRAAERERIKAAVTRCTLFAENCDGDGPEVDTARKALACTILAAIAGYEAPPPVGTPGSLF